MPACAAATHESPAAARSAPHRATSDRPGKAVRALRADLSRVFGAPIMSRGVWGVVVRSLDTGETLFELDADRLMMPASNMKIVTLAAAAEMLGWDYRFTTTLETSAPIEGGVLKGDLIVRGGGDPTINTREGRATAVLLEWIAALRGTGIQAVDGRIVGDDRAFDDEGLGQGWAWDYLQFGYAAPVGALQFNENLATLAIGPAQFPGEPARVTLSSGSGLRLMNRARTAVVGTANEINYRRRLDEPVLEVTGSIAIGTPTLMRTVAVVNPTLYFAQSVKDALVESGIGVSGPAADMDDIAPELASHMEGVRVLATTQSPPLRDIATVLMKVSQNLYAETLIKAVGAQRGGLGTYEGGLGAVRTTIESWGIKPDAYVIADGSGLSRYNYVTARTIATILERMHAEERYRGPFAATLPIAGKDGSLSTRLQRTRAEGNALAKTGSISNVRSLSGYVRTRDGETLVFSMIANDFVITAATVNWIADLAVEHLANFTRR